MSALGEFLLRKLSRDPSRPDHVTEAYAQRHQDPKAQVHYLESTFPDIKSMISEKLVLDIGCSEGLETLALSILGAREVLGIDIRIDKENNQRIRKEHLENHMKFAFMDAQNTGLRNDTFDAVVTCGSFEHFADPYLVLKESARVLKEDGRILLTSGVWAHPWGAHMNFFTAVPWVQFLFSETTIMNVRRLYRNDGARRFSEVEGGLNKIGVRTFKKIVKELHLHPEYFNLEAVKGMKPLTTLPFVGELFTGLIVAVLRKGRQI